MALINCPQCGKQISDKARKCPHCGLDLSVPYAPQQRATITPEQKPRKKKWWIVLVVLGIIALLALWFFVFNKGEEKRQTPSNSVAVNTEPIKEEHQRPRIYSNCFDGYLNIRQEPNTQATILGRLNNGPEGAVLLSREGNWTKVNCNGIVGYVYTKYTQETPTVAYTGTATIDQIAGVYEYCYGFCQYLFLYYDGTYRIGGEDNEMGKGRYVLQNNEVKLMPVYEDNAYSDVIEHILPIDVSHNKLGKYIKQPFLTESDMSRAKAQYGEYWREEMYGENVYLGTLKDFKKLSALE